MILIFTKKYQCSSPVLDSFLRGKYYLVLIILTFFSTTNVSAQVLVAGTQFTPTSPVAGKTYYGIIDIAQYGMITGNIAVTPPFTPSANPNIFNATPNYAITTNPANLDAVRYENLPAATNYMFVASSATSTPSTLLSYTVPGLVPGSAITANITYCYVISPAYATCTVGEILSLKAVLNPDANNGPNGLEGTQLHAGQCLTTALTITQATSNSMVVPSSGTAVLNINNQQTGSCKAVGISKIEIFATPQPIVVSSEGTDVCNGEQSILTLKQAYDVGTAYVWEVSTNNGGSWAAASGTNTKSAYLLTAAATGTSYQYRAKVTYSGTTYTTAPVIINSINCCTVGGSRKQVFYDDFGTLDLAADPTGKTYKVWDYTNPLNPVQVTKTTTTPFRWQLATPPPGTSPAITSPGPVNDNQYIVAAGLTGYNPSGGYTGAMLQWAGDVGGWTTQPDPSYDHSGDFTGGALFLNVPAHTQNQVIYTRPISNLCGGKQVFFECWINVFTSSAPGTYYPVNIAVKLIDASNAANFTTASATATNQAGGGGPWVEIKGSLTLGAGSTGLTMQIINNQDDPATGDDLVLDDIRVYACSPPNINLVFDKTTLTTNEIECTTTMDMFSLYPATLATYYTTPYFLFQYSYTPLVNTSWVNIGTPATLDSYTMTSPKTNSIFTGVPTTGGNVYFRVIAAAQSTFTTNVNFGPGHPASQTDVCQNYSVSDPISAHISCPLPVELVNFAGIKQGSSIQLSWTTSSEKNNDYFQIERSTNGVDFTVVGKVDGKGNSNNLEEYNFQDNQPSDDINYYRLKQVDVDGQSNYSKILAFYNSKQDLDIYPNPNDGSFSIHMKSESDSYKLDITDLQGKNVYSLSGTEVPENIQVNNLSEGIYILRLYIDSEVITRKLVVY